MRRWPPSWHRRTPNSPAKSASALRLPVPAPPSAHRALRRAARPHAGARHRRPAGARRARRALPAGGRPASAVQGCRRRVRAQATTPAQVRHLIDRAMRIAQADRTRHLHHPAERSAGEHAVRDAAARTRHACTPASASPTPRAVPDDADLRRAADVLNAGKNVAILVGAGALACDRRGDRGRRQARRGRRQGAARQGGASRRSAVGHRLDRPARHQAKLGHDERMRHAADDRLRLSLFGVPAEGRPGARRADRHRAGHAEPALSDGGQSRRRRARNAARTAAAARAEDRSRLARARSRRMSPIGGRLLEERAMQPADPVNPQRVFWELSPRLPGTRSSPATPALAPTGTRAI